MICIINTGVANIHSVVNALARLDVEATVTSNPELITKASHVILPGVGHAQASMRALNALELGPIIRGLRQPVLGICLGMQLLYESTDEGDTTALGMIPGRVAAISATPDLPLPHMGWNSLLFDDPSSPLLRGIFAGDRVYFVHSFRAPVDSHVRASTDYGEKIPALVSRNNFFGTQFHPERSGPVGLSILRNFISL